MPNDVKRQTAAALLTKHQHPAEIVFGVMALGFAVFLLLNMDGQLKYYPNLVWYKQPGLWPGFAIVGMTTFGLFEVLFYFHRQTEWRPELLRAEVFRWFRALEFAIWFMAYVWLTMFLGYLLSSVLFCCLLCWRLAYRSGTMLRAAVAVALSTVVVFKAGLSVKIPGGQFYEFLPDAVRDFMIIYL